MAAVHTNRRATRTRIAFFCLLLAAAVGGCRSDEEAPVPGTEGSGETPDEGNFATRVYERNFVFAATEGDSVFIVPWLMHTFESPDTVMREARGWLARSGIWEAFYAERWWTPSTRAPSRVLPHQGLRLLVGDEDAIDGVLFEEGAEGDRAYVVESGEMEIVKRSRTRDVLVKRSGPGEVIGEMAIPDGFALGCPASAGNALQIFVSQQSLGQR